MAGRVWQHPNNYGVFQTCKPALEPTPGIEPETSFLPRTSLPALWHPPVDPERNASNYGVVRFPWHLFPCSNDPKGRSVDPYESGIALNDHRKNRILAAQRRSGFDQRGSWLSPSQPRRAPPSGRTRLGHPANLQMLILRTSPCPAAIKARHHTVRLEAFVPDGNGHSSASRRGVFRSPDGVACAYAEIVSNPPTPFATANKRLTLVRHRLSQGLSNARDSGCQVWNASFFVRMQEQKPARSDPLVERLLQRQRIGRTLQFVTH